MGLSPEDEVFNWPSSNTSESSQCHALRRDVAVLRPGLVLDGNSPRSDEMCAL